MREGGSWSGRREGGLRKGTSEEGTELGMEGKRRGRKRAEEGGCNRVRERYREERVRKGDREGNFHGCTLMRTLGNLLYIAQNYLSY